MVFAPISLRNRRTTIPRAGAALSNGRKHPGARTSGNGNSPMPCYREMRGWSWMRAIGVVLFVPWILTAQAVPPPVPLESAALVSGVILECDARPSGEFSIRAAGNRVLRYQFDHKTYVERDDHLIEAARLAPGEKVEVLSDTVAGYTLRYARTIHVIKPVPPPRPLTLGRLRAYDPKT